MPNILRSVRYAVFLALFFALASQAQNVSTQIDIVPSSPTTADDISIKLSGTWGSGCVPQDPKVTVSGQTIRIDTSNPGSICTAVLAAWSLTVPIGRLAAGSYTVVATYSSPVQKAFEIARKTIDVTASNQPPAQELILPIVVNGRVGSAVHYQTAFTVLNNSAIVALVNAQIYDSSGSPAGVFCSPIAPPPSRFTASLSPAGSFHNSTSADQPLTNGWARLTWDGTAAVQAEAEINFINTAPMPCLLICNRPSNEIIASASVPAVKAARDFRLPATLTPNRQTAIALVNPQSGGPATVTLQLLGSDGQVVVGGAVSTQVPPQGRVAQFLRRFFECDICMAAPTFAPGPMFHGSLKITSDIPIAVGALNVIFPEGKLVSVPVSSP
ncbi:MAG TPA: hypothetical protein VGQ81_01085 [Acidobacteriota bacterium]|jgi:hypothetical protein|nr:hypothetical protein [Acidobacteriota bacterium]